MIREVDLLMYLPLFMQSYREPVEALKAENPEFMLIWNATDRVLYNRFIATADEYGISRFERMLKISPVAEDTLESRRARVQSRWFNTIPYTWRVLLQKMIVLCSDTHFVMTGDFETGYTLTLATNLELFGQVEELENMIKTMIPENIVVDSMNSIPCEAAGSALTIGGTVFINGFEITGDFRETYNVNGSFGIGGGMGFVDIEQATDAYVENWRADGSFAAGGGIVQTEFIQASETFNENYQASGNALAGGGIVHTEQTAATDGFNETYQTSGTALSAAGVVSVEFIEIN